MPHSPCRVNNFPNMEFFFNYRFFDIAYLGFKRMFTAIKFFSMVKYDNPYSILSSVNSMHKIKIILDYSLVTAKQGYTLFSSDFSKSLKTISLNSLNWENW